MDTRYRSHSQIEHDGQDIFTLIDSIHSDWHALFCVVPNILVVLINTRLKKAQCTSLRFPVIYSVRLFH